MAFHAHPQFIQKLFNAYWFGPPEGVTLPGEVKLSDQRSRSEGESEQGVESWGADAKPGDLPLARMKVG